MANFENQCKDLIVKDFFTEHKEKNKDFDSLCFLYDHQKNFQENVLGLKFDDASLYEIAQFFLKNKHALNDELHEMLDALGGIHDGQGSGVWKWWKKSNESYKNLKLSDLSERDKKELFMEFVDAFHFFLNFAIVIGFSPEDIFNFYVTKLEENKNRQKRNY